MKCFNLLSNKATLLTTLQETRPKALFQFFYWWFDKHVMKTSPWIASIPLHHPHGGMGTTGAINVFSDSCWASCDENSFLNGLPRTILDSTLHYKTIWFKLFSFIIRSFDCHVTDKPKLSLILRFLISKTRQQHGSSNPCLAIKDLVNRLTDRMWPIKTRPFVASMSFKGQVTQ